MILLDPRYTWMRQLTGFALLLAIWEAAGRAGMLNPMYAPNPSRVGAALGELFSDGRIWRRPSPPRSAVSRWESSSALCWASWPRSCGSSRKCWSP